MGTRGLEAAAAGTQLLDAGCLTEARERFAEALGEARAAGDAETFAVAALGLGGVWVHEHRTAVEQTHVLALQREGLGRVEPRSPLGARLRARLAAEESYVTGDPALVLAALDEARASGDARRHAEALSLTHHCLLGPDHGADRLALADELLAVSATTDRGLDALIGLAWRTVDLFLLGDAHAERSFRELRTRPELAGCGCIRYVAAALDVMLAIRAGRLDEAERLAEECYSLGVTVGDADALGWYGAQLVTIRWLQGRAAELLPLVADLAESPTLAKTNDAYFAAVAALASWAGRVDDASAALARLRTRGLAATRNSSGWMATMLGVIEAAYVLGDAAAAREAYDLLAPHAELPVMASLAVACFGSAHRPLGLAALAFDDVELAVAHLDAARHANLRLGHRPCYVISCAQLADALERRGDWGDAERAADLRQTAADGADALGMTARAAAWRSASAAVPTVECRPYGRRWLVTFGRRATKVAHSVGMEYLATLIDAPGVEFAAIQLASGNHLVVSGSQQPVLDDDARQAYRRRVEDLGAEIEEAEAYCDVERATRARLELDRLMDELARVTGLGGRERRFGDEAERARTSVQKAIKRALDRIHVADAVIGRELARRVVTGGHCVYLPHGA